MRTKTREIVENILKEIETSKEEGCTRIQKTDTSGEGNSYGLWSIVQLELYGHRENDLVRLPDPTNVLKYPHIAMTGPAQRGYVVTASASDTDVGGNHAGTSLYQPYSVFDDVSGTEWLGKVVKMTDDAMSHSAFKKARSSALRCNAR